MKKARHPAEQVKQMPIERLIPYARNSRTHSDAQVAQIAASIKEWGWTTPVLIDEGGQIIAGHGRIMAARKLGMAEVPVIIAEGWTEAQKKAYVIADNKLALNAGWDESLLALEFGELDGLGFDLELTGFSLDELKSILADADQTEFPTLANGDRNPIQQMAFILHDEQVEIVKAAIEIAKEMGEFVDTGNENGNGNALARICELFVGEHGNS